MNKNHHRTLYWMLVLLLGTLLAACSSGDAAPTEAVDNMPVEDFTPVVSATGIVEPDRWATLSFASGGQLTDLLIQRGQTVDQGELLAQLGNVEQARSALTAAQLELINARQTLDDLYENADLYTAQARLELANARDYLDDAEYDWRVQQEGYRASDETIDEAEANLVLAENEVDRAKDAYDRLSGRSEDDGPRALALSNLSAARQRRDAIIRRLNWYKGFPTEIEQAILDAEVAEAEARLATAEREYEKVKDGPDPEAVELAEARLANAEAAVQAAEQALDDAELRANFNGTVSEVYVREGEFVAPGQPILVMADLENLKVETTDLNEIDVAQIEIGNTATVTFDALPDVSLQGTVTYIAPKASEGTGVNYPVEIRLDDELPQDVRWGMTAFVDIELQQ
ncbi:MAG: efflux RND transporter periplasmic adaptor subunit [Anaerolineales bacterium]